MLLFLLLYLTIYAVKKLVKIILDTSIFVNPDSRHFFGKTPYYALINFLERLKNKKDIRCYIPPSVYEELMKFMETEITLKETILIHKKPPSSYSARIPALFFYEFVEEMRLRINKGLRIAEKYTRKECGKENEGEIIKNLREEFRAGVREGVVDSKEDVDLIILAHETKACLATSDNGLIKWAHKLGIRCITAHELNELVSYS